MSRYVIRHVEAKYDLVEGSVYRTEDLPKDAPDGVIYRAWQCESKFYKKVNGEWVGQETCPTEWRLLSGYQPTRKSKDTDEEWRKNATKQFKDPSTGLDVYFLQHTEFANNGGAIRDDYISSHGWGGERCPFRGRGVPDDISPETREEMTYETTWETDVPEKRLRGYDHTWCTLSEWNALYDSEEMRILGLINDAHQKQSNNLVHKKLDFLIKHMKDPMTANIEELYQKQVDDEGNEIEEDENDYYESPEYIREEYMINLFLIAEEIGRIKQICDWNEVWDDAVRIIYYIE